MKQHCRKQGYSLSPVLFGFVTVVDIPPPPSLPRYCIKFVRFLSGIEHNRVESAKGVKFLKVLIFRGIDCETREGLA